MTNDADTVKVIGNFVMQSTASHDGRFSAGVLSVGGDLIQENGGSNANLHTTGTFEIVLDGTDEQHISIYNNSKNYSRIAGLKVENTSDAGVSFDRGVYVVGNLYDTDSVIVHGENINISSSTVFADEKFSDTIRIADNYRLQEDITIDGDVHLTGGSLDLNGHTLTVTGNLNISDSGTLYMVNENDRIVVDGNMLANGYYRSTLTDGTIEVKGNFTQKYTYYTDNFRANGNHRVIFNGNGLQTVSFDRMESGFNILEINNHSDEGVVFSTPVTINELEDNGCNVTFANGERPGWVLSGDETIEGDLFLARGTLDLNGHKLTVTGDLVQSGGEIIVNSGELVVQGDYRIQSLKNGSYTNSTGTLNMTNDADTVKVIGNFVMQSTASHDGRFSAGVLSVGGDLIQENGGSNANLHTTGTFEIVLDGTDEQHISIYNNSKNYSRIAGLKVENTSDAGVSFDRGVYVVGNLYDTDSVIVHGENINISSSTVFADEKFSDTIRIADNYRLQEDITIDGDVHLTGGSLDLNGHTLTVTGNLNISDSGTLYMVNENDRIVVDGNMLANGYYRSTLTDGTIEVKGNFTQKYTYYTDNFRASDNHRVILNGNGFQKISFEREESGFNKLEITKNIDTGYSFNRKPVWKELIENIPSYAKPSTPTELHTENTTATSVKVAWNASEDSSGIDCYYVYRDEILLKGDNRLLGTTKELSFVDSGLTPTSEHRYYVVSRSVNGVFSEPSEVLIASSGADEHAPTRPENLTAKADGDSTIKLSWIASSDNVSVDHYNIYRIDRSVQGYTTGVLIGSTSGTVYRDTTAFAGYYDYYVEAVDNDGNRSSASNKVSVDNDAPSAPVLSVGRVSDRFISLEWTSSDNVGIAFYNVYKNGQLVKVVTANTYVDTNVESGQTYSYQVVAYDMAGNSSESNTLTVSTADDTAPPVVTKISAGKAKYSGSAEITVNTVDDHGVAEIYVQGSTDKKTWNELISVNAGGRTTSSFVKTIDVSDVPDGSYYVRAYAKDTSDNISSVELSPVYELKVDNTAPDIPTDISASIDNGAVQIIWNPSDENDVDHFRIYRKDVNESTYKLIKDNHRYRNYFDSNIELGARYSYYVTAVDDVSNESAPSASVISGLSDDTISPEILSVYPSSGSVLETNQIVSASVKDNYRIDKVIAECRRVGEEWKEVYSENNIGANWKNVEFELDTSGFTNGDYELRITAFDTSGNPSESFEGSYTFKECTLSAPVLSAQGEGYRNVLSWTMENTDDLAGYNVYRKTSAVGEYICIASITNSSYTDDDLNPGQAYYYRVEAADTRNNYVDSNEICSIPTNEDDIAPEANAGNADKNGYTGQAISFDGSMSQDNRYVAEYIWDFGEGTTATGAKVSHSYAAENIDGYTVTLTVKDGYGNTDTCTIKAYIYGEDYGDAVFTLVDNGTPINGVKISCNVPGMDNTELTTDEKGEVQIIAPAGVYDVYFYKNGYLPSYSQVVIGRNTHMQSTVTLEKKELVEGKLSVRQLDIEEIIERGIDVFDPANQFIYEYEIDYGTNGKLGITLNAKGDIIGSVDGRIQTERGGVYTTVATIAADKYSRRRATYGGYKQGTGTVPVSVAVFNVSVQTSWLKEFFDADLTVINNADENFWIDDAKAVLSLPEGLSLADTARGESLIQIMGQGGYIGGTKSSTASWTIRGDEPGEYDLTAEFTGTLMPMQEDVKTIFKTETPLVVHDGEGLGLDITLIAGLDYWKQDFIFTNNSERPIYNFSASFMGAGSLVDFDSMYIYYPDGTVEVVEINQGIPDPERSEILRPALLEDEEIFEEDMLLDKIRHRTIEPGQSVHGYFFMHREDGLTNDD